MINRKRLEGLTRRQRAAVFATGRVTTGKVSTYSKRSRRFIDWWVGKVGGAIVTDRRGYWKHKTEATARRAAAWFKWHSARVAAGKN